MKELVKYFGKTHNYDRVARNVRLKPLFSEKKAKVAFVQIDE
jgi:hypothetical protein